MTRVGNYRLVSPDGSLVEGLPEPVGRGGMAAVWRAVPIDGDPRPVALKILGQLGRPEGFQRALAREIRAVSRLDHPAIVAVFDHGVIPGGTALEANSPWFASEWADGGSLEAGISSFPELANVARALLSGLAHAHARGVLHRDLKPANILRIGNRWALADFGIAHLDDDAEDGAAGWGTPAYMAPEQIRVRAGAQGPQTDIYALGCLIWELATGAPPFDGDTAAVRRAHLRDSLPPFRPRFLVPSGFLRWLDICLQKSPEDRFRFAGLALRAFEALPGPPTAPRWDEAPFAQWADPRVGPALARVRPVPFVGRSGERLVLREALQDAIQRRRPRAVWIGGEAGVGKSRLASWLGERAHELGVANTLTVRLFGAPSALEATRIALGRLLHVDEVDAEERISALLGGEADAVTRWLAEGGDVSATEARARLVELLVALSKRAALVLVLDGIERIDDAPALVDRLIEPFGAASGAPLLVLTIGGAPTPGAAELELLPLDTAERSLLSRSVLGLVPSLAAALDAGTAGNPQALVATVRAWCDRRWLVASPAGWRLRDGVRAEVPADLDGLWRDRVKDLLARLDPEAIRAVEVMAALGVQIDTRDWQAACVELGLGSSWSASEALLAARLLVQIGEHEMRFAHPSVVATLIGSARRAGHWVETNSAIARALRQRDADPERVATHQLEAGATAEALPALLDASARRRRGGDLAWCSMLLGRVEPIIAALDPADPQRGRFWCERLNVLRISGQSRLADELARPATREALLHNWEHEAAEIRYHHAEAKRQLGDLRGALALADASLAGFRRLGPSARVELALSTRSSTLRQLGRNVEALADAREALPHWLSRDIAFGHAMGHLVVAIATNAAGAEDDIPHLRAAERIAREHGHADLRATALHLLGNRLREDGDLEAAAASYDEAARLFWRAGSGQALLAELDLAATRARVAGGRVARERLEPLREHPHRKGSATINIGFMLTDALLDAIDGDPDAAVASARAAVDEIARTSIVDDDFEVLAADAARATRARGFAAQARSLDALATEIASLAARRA